MATATITSKHQVTIPKEVRRQMQLHEGDQINFEANSAGLYILKKCESVALSDGAAAKYIKGEKRLTVEEIKTASKAGAWRSFKGREW